METQFGVKRLFLWFKPPTVLLTQEALVLQIISTSKNPCYAQATWDWICLKKTKQNKTKQNKKAKQNKNKQTNKQKIKN